MEKEVPPVQSSDEKERLDEAYRVEYEAFAWGFRDRGMPFFPNFSKKKKKPDDI